MNCVYGFEIKTGASALFNLEESRALVRRYLLEKEVRIIIHTDDGDLECWTGPNFIFDGRSGGPLLDWYAPNLGTLEERIAWYFHDVLGYAQSLDFKDTNRLLRLFLRDICGYRAAKAWLIEKAVSISKSWYGWPKDGEWCSFNKDRVNSRWIPKKAR